MKREQTVMRLMVVLLVSSCIASGATRIKDIAYVNGVRGEQLIGYGLVVGLNGSGDTQRSTFTLQSVSSMLKRFGITVPETDLRLRNVAAVMVTATVPSFAKEGGVIDVIASSMGDATSLQGGTLLMTPLSGADGAVYALAQGPLSVGGFSANAGGNEVRRNHTAAGAAVRDPVRLEVALVDHVLRDHLVARRPDEAEAHGGVPAGGRVDGGGEVLRVVSFHRSSLAAPARRGHRAAPLMRPPSRRAGPSSRGRAATPPRAGRGGGGLRSPSGSGRA